MEVTHWTRPAAQKAFLYIWEGYSSPQTDRKSLSYFHITTTIWELTCQSSSHQIDNLNLVPSLSIWYWANGLRELFLLRNTGLSDGSRCNPTKRLVKISEDTSRCGMIYQFIRLASWFGSFSTSMDENKSELNLRSQRNGDSSLLKRENVFHLHWVHMSHQLAHSIFFNRKA